MIPPRSALAGRLSILAVSFAGLASALNHTVAPALTSVLFTVNIEVGKPLQPIPIPGGVREGEVAEVLFFSFDLTQLSLLLLSYTDGIIR